MFSEVYRTLVLASYLAFLMNYLFYGTTFATRQASSILWHCSIDCCAPFSKRKL